MPGGAEDARLAHPGEFAGRRRGAGRAAPAPLARFRRDRPTAASPHAGIDRLRVTEGRWPGAEPSTPSRRRSASRSPWRAGPDVAGSSHERRRRRAGAAHDVGEQRRRRDWRSRPDGFWQVHPGAARTLVEAVIDGCERATGERAFDLYCGVGLFAGALADAGVPGRSSPSSPTPRRRARPAQPRRPANVAVLTAGSTTPSGSPARRGGPPAAGEPTAQGVTLHALPTSADLVVLDPPRTGAGRGVITDAHGAASARVAYVACDPAALARDLGLPRRPGLPARQHAGLRPLPDDPPRRVRRDASCRPDQCR